MSEIIFAYGTLRRGLHNSYLIDKPNNQWLGMGKTIEKYEMWSTGIPYVNKTPRSQIVIDAWVVNSNEDLAALDLLEGHPNWYKREKIKAILDDGNEVEGWMYFNDEHSGNLIENGDFKYLKKY